MKLRIFTMPQTPGTSELRAFYQTDLERGIKVMTLKIGQWDQESD